MMIFCGGRVLIFFVYLSAAILASIALCVLEPLGLDAVLFEVVSALCTVGISMGITPMRAGCLKHNHCSDVSSDV